MLLYLESFGNPRKFARIARRVARRKPILAMKAGTTGAGARAASSHTAALAGSDAAVDALFRQAGVIRARHARGARRRGRAALEPAAARAAAASRVLTNAGGLGILCADACEAAGLELPELSRRDARGAGRRAAARGERREPGRHARLGDGGDLRGALPPLLADPRVDALIVLFVPPVVAGADEVAEAIRARSPRRAPDEAGARGRDQRRGMPAALREPAARSPRSPTRSRRRARSASRPSGPSGCGGRSARVPELDGIDTRRRARASSTRRSAGRASLARPGRSARAARSAYGVPLVPERLAATADEAVAAARELGFPVVVKTAAAGAHKTERGGVALDLRDEDEVRAAVERIGRP